MKILHRIKLYLTCMIESHSTLKDTNFSTESSRASTKTTSWRKFKSLESTTVSKCLRKRRARLLRENLIPKRLLETVLPFPKIKSNACSL